MTDFDILRFLTVALAAGLIVGFERGWHEREIEEGGRVAGIRTFALIGMSGGLVSIIAINLNVMFAGIIALGFAGLLVAIRLRSPSHDVGATTEVAGIVTFCFGVLSGMGYAMPAIAGAVVSALILGSKPILHRWLRSIDERELFAALQLLLISAVVLPLLPNEEFGPFQALNPYRIWLMVVLVAGVSFAGYVAVRSVGSRGGMLLTGLAGGLVASTATTLALIRDGLRDPALRSSVPMGIAAASTVMLVRVFLLAVIIHPPLWSDLIGPFGMMAIASAGATAALWRPAQNDTVEPALLGHENPLDLRSAVMFGGILAIVMLLVASVRGFLGTPGILVLSALSGLVDVDAIAMSLADQASKAIGGDIVVSGLIIAVTANTAVKIVIAAVIGPADVARRVALGLSMVIVSGLAVVTWNAFVQSP